MSDTIKRLFLDGRLSADGVRNAVKKGWITEKEAENILLLRA